MSTKITTNLVGRVARRMPKRMSGNGSWPLGLEEFAEIVAVRREKLPGARPAFLVLSVVDRAGRTGEVRFESATVEDTTLAKLAEEYARAATLPGGRS